MQLEAQPLLKSTVVLRMQFQFSTIRRQDPPPVARRTFRCHPQVDPNEERLAKWTRCQLSGEPLAPPCVADELGHLFNKDAIVSGAACGFPSYVSLSVSFWF